jgi:hypothetical protein
MAGIYNTAPGSATRQMVIIDNNGNLGSSTRSSFTPPMTTETAATNLIAGNMYYSNGSSVTVVFTLPSTAAVGDTF